MKSIIHNQFCNNCGKTGHSYNQCSKPITSLGIIAFNKTINSLKYLLICRKDSLGYVEFMRGKYPLYNNEYIQNIINEMTIQEKANLLTKEFDELGIIAKAKGFLLVSSSPLTRSSYHADEDFFKLQLNRKNKH